MVKVLFFHRLEWSYTHSDAHVILPVANKAWITLLNVDDDFGIHVEADQNASKQVPCSWPQSPHHIHNSWKTQTTTHYKPRSVHPHNIFFFFHFTGCLIKAVNVLSPFSATIDSLGDWVSHTEMMKRRANH